MSTTDTHPSAVAELVVLYRRTRDRCGVWRPSKVDHRLVDAIVETSCPQLRKAIQLSTEAGGPIVGLAAVAFLLVDEGNDWTTVARFLNPDPAAEPIEDTDPRLALHRVMKQFALNPKDHRPQETVGYALKAWGLWVTGSQARTLHWQLGDGMPRIANWPAYRLPGVSTTDT